MIFSIDFYVLNMSDDSYTMSMPLLFGRPLTKIAHTKINVHSGEITLEFYGELICFTIFEAMRYLDDGGDDFGYELNKFGWRC